MPGCLQYEPDLAEPACCMTVPRLAAQTGTKVEKLYEYATRKDDPLPIRYYKGKERSGFVIVPELYDWMSRNTCLFTERKRYVQA